MKLLMLCANLTLFTCLAAAQSNVSHHIAGMSPEEVNQRIDNTIREPFGPVVRSQILEESLKSGRIDLIQVCFANLRTSSETEQAILEMPDGELKQRATIMMLRTPNHLQWPPDVPPLNSDIRRPPLMREPFVSIISKLLPHVELNENWLKYQAGRARLANDMEAVLNAKGAESASKQDQAPQTLVPQAQLQSTPSQTPTTIPVQKSSFTAVARGDDGFGGYVIWLVGGAAAFIALAWVAWKKRSKE